MFAGWILGSEPVDVPAKPMSPELFLPTLIKVYKAPDLPETEVKQIMVVHEDTIARYVDAPYVVFELLITSSFFFLEFAAHGKRVVIARSITELASELSQMSSAVLYLHPSVAVRRSALYLLFRMLGKNQFSIDIVPMGMLERAIFPDYSVLANPQDSFSITYAIQKISRFYLVKVSEVQMTTLPLVLVWNRVWDEHPDLTLDSYYLRRKLRGLLRTS